MLTTTVRMLLVLSFVLVAGALFGQTAATLSGTATDSTGAVIPGVEIVLTNADTGETYTASTNAVRSFTIPFIKPGNFILTAETAGFKKY